MAILNPITTEKPVKELKDTIVPNVDKLSRSTFDTLYYRRGLLHKDRKYGNNKSVAQETYSKGRDE